MRETLQMFALIHDASSRIAIDPKSLFEDAASHAVRPELREALRQFPWRKPQDRSIEAMGFQTVGGGESFRYDRRW